jgi:hypothetical protein
VLGHLVLEVIGSGNCFSWICLISTLDEYNEITILNAISPTIVGSYYACIPTIYYTANDVVQPNFHWPEKCHTQLTREIPAVISQPSAGVDCLNRVTYTIPSSHSAQPVPYIQLVIGISSNTFKSTAAMLRQISTRSALQSFAAPSGMSNILLTSGKC